MTETRRIEIDPLTRLEGHGKVTLRLDEAGQVADAQLHVVEFRGFERFVQGRPYEEIPVLVQRLCGICPVSHHLAAAKAMDTIAGASQLTPSAQKLRRLLHLAQVLQSHALHFFYLASPDLLFGISDARAKRGVMAVLDAYPEVALQGIRLRKFGQQIIEALAGKRIHGVMALPGGVNKHLALRDRDVLLAQADAVVESAERAVALVADVQRRQPALFGVFGRVASNCLSLVGPEDDLELYDGRLRAIDATGHPIVESLEPARYAELISEAVQPWSYMKFPYIRQLGSEAGWYRVGPLPRLKTCASIAT
ncbi:MAG: Ni/Fe hydrogenase subunit alpha, partial [Chloroflexi bacterium]|nr:Ni/Fe hydrogenase subunit alpha [Chloroflexota bacterium]